MISRMSSWLNRASKQDLSTDRGNYVSFIIAVDLWTYKIVFAEIGKQNQAI